LEKEVGLQAEQFMRAALEEARRAMELGDVPVGAVAVLDGKIIARGKNEREHLQDPTAHAEILALQTAARTIGSWRLNDVDLYVTLEPCAMCTGAIVLARIRNLYFGAPDPRAGAVISAHRLLADERLNHSVKVYRGILENECEEILEGFFASKR